MNYYNEFDAHAADWLENLIKEGLIPNGKVDRRSIAEVSPDDLRGFRQCHFFCGVAGWPIAFRLAGWGDDRECWSGSCPCQPWSVAGKGEGAEDERHLWPVFFKLIEACRPPIVFGEQVAGSDVVGKVDRKNGHDPEEPPVWLDGVSADMEGASYAFTAFDLPAACINSPNIRQRIWWLGVDVWLASTSGTERGWWNESTREHGRALHATDRCETGGLGDTSEPRRTGRKNSRADRSDATANEGGSFESERDVSSSGMEHAASNERKQRRTESNGRSIASGCGVDGMGNSESQRRDTEQQPEHSTERNAITAGVGGSDDGMGDAESCGRSGRQSIGSGTSSTLPSSPWSDYRIVHCTDERNRRVSAQSGDEPLAYGIPQSCLPVVSELERMGHSPKDVKRFKRSANQLLAKARRNRVVRLKAYGNAINPFVAAEFIRAYMEIEGTK